MSVFSAVTSVVSPAVQSAVFSGGGTSPPVSAFLIEEGFEGVGIPSNFATLSGTPDYDYTAAPIDESKSMFLDGSVTTASELDFSTLDTFPVTYGAFKFILSNATPSSDFQIFRFRESDGTLLGRMDIRTSGVFRLTYKSSFLTVASLLVAGTTYYLKYIHTQGTGSDESMEIFLSKAGDTDWGDVGSVIASGKTGLNRMGKGDYEGRMSVDVTLDSVRVRGTDIPWGLLP